VAELSPALILDQLTRQGITLADLAHGYWLEVAYVKALAREALTTCDPGPEVRRQVAVLRIDRMLAALAQDADRPATRYPAIAAFDKLQRLQVELDKEPAVATGSELTDRDIMHVLITGGVDPLKAHALAAELAGT
jgi:hypothetical protein